MKVGVVLGYGLFTPERKDYKAYLDSVARHIGEDGLDRAILCGGFTDPKQPDKSEAGTIKEYLLSANPNFNQYVLEEESINTNQNIEFAAKEISEEDEVYIYCDSIRLPKVFWIAAHFILGKSQTEIARVFIEYAKTGSTSVDINKPIVFERLRTIGFDFPKEKGYIIAQTAASLVDVMSLYNEEIKNLDEEVRKEIFGI